MCGADHKYHFIIRYRNPKTGLYSEHQAKKPTEALDTYFTDKKSHLYTLGKQLKKNMQKTTFCLPFQLSRQTIALKCILTTN